MNTLETTGIIHNEEWMGILGNPNSPIAMQLWIISWVSNSINVQFLYHGVYIYILYKVGVAVFHEWGIWHIITSRDFTHSILPGILV